MSRPGLEGLFRERGSGTGPSPFSRAHVLLREVQWVWSVFAWRDCFYTKFTDFLARRRSLACSPPLTKPARQGSEPQNGVWWIRPRPKER